jgi:hypothetical protein
VLLHQPERSGKPRGAQPVVLCDSNLWLKPELRFAGFVMSVNVHPWLFPGEKVEPVASDRKIVGLIALSYLTDCQHLPGMLRAVERAITQETARRGEAPLQEVGGVPGFGYEEHRVEFGGMVAAFCL